MLKTTVDNGTEKLGLQEEITETSAVDTDIPLLHGSLVTSTSLLSILNGLRRDLNDLLVFLIINKFVSRSGHFS